MREGTLPARRAPAADDRIEVMLLVAALCGLAAVLGLTVAGVVTELILGPALGEAVMLSR